MFYSFSHTITTSDIESSKYRLDMKLTAGVIHQVDVLFEDGCNHEAHVQIFQADHQLWPTNRGGSLVGNAIVISFREFFQLSYGLSDLYAYIWGDGSIENVDVIINIGVLPGKIIKPFQLEDLLNLAMSKE